MTQQQKMAWFTLVICVAVLVVYGVLTPLVGPKGAMAAFAIMSLWAFSGRFFRKRPGVAAAAVVFDERDRDIHAKAVKVCAACVYLYFFACCYTMSQLRSAAGTVPVQWLNYMLAFGALVLLLSWSLAALLLYRKDAREAA